jgi:hypothetical protein
MQLKSFFMYLSPEKDEAAAGHLVQTGRARGKNAL